MFNIVQSVILSAGIKELFLLLCFLSLSFKSYLLSRLLRSRLQLPLTAKLLRLIALFLGGLLLADIAWINVLTKRIFGLKQLLPVMAFFCRLSWSFYTMHYIALGFFVIYFVNKEYKLSLVDKFFVFVSALISSYFCIGAFVGFGLPELYFETNMVNFSILYIFLFSMWTIYNFLKKSHYKSAPQILRQQLRVLFYYLIIPQLFFEILNLKQLSAIFQLNVYWLNSFITTISALALYYCCRQIMGMRFLNLSTHVESNEKFNFVTDFKDILEQLSYVTSLNELSHLTQTFFERAFSIPRTRVRLYLRQDEMAKAHYDSIFADKQDKIEKFFVLHEQPNDAVTAALFSSKILIKDEIEFTNFYEETQLRNELIAFMQDINVDIFLPLYERKQISGYIIVEYQARPQQLYTSKERDEMLVFTNYVSNIINLIKYNNVHALQKREKELQEELYHKHQEINHYKESIRSFLRTNKDRKIGIIFYRGRRFSYANEAAQELISFDINVQQGHPLTIALKNITRKVHEYKTAQTGFTFDEHGHKLVVTGLPSLEHNSVIIILYYPEISDVMRTQLEQMKDPSKWDYMLYLETTHSGQLINQLIPGNGEGLLNFKIALLEAALSKKAILLDMADDDILPTVELLHHISMRQQMHTLKLTTPERNHEVAIKLFGLNPLLGSKEEGVLKMIDNGTLFIENIHYLSLETQEMLAGFIEYGYFNKYRSDQKETSNVRVICSTPKDLIMGVREGYFSKTLLDELKKSSLVMPSLTLLSDYEVYELAEAFSHQALKSETFKNLIHLSEKDKSKLLNQRPISLHELKDKVLHLLMSKSSKHKLVETTEFDPAYHITDPELVQAVRLGKKALKDPHIMAMLWNKFKNQNKIALLLGVNRSSVNRRCQEYNLYESDKVH